MFNLMEKRKRETSINKIKVAEVAEKLVKVFSVSIGLF